ncbi:molybdate ABC transporter permease subunit [Desulfosporosinus sp. FKA]|uniref:molybdate ABC transporter permease subunit n=1 Tax=Desulfosporosinus sp. FKA TaxID=1969834 RepID=UPI000B49F008|nr:molybdate ABC transporter permease subunit [Desulfosporosinus sp. FKA]
MRISDLFPLYLSLYLALTATLFGLLIGLPIAWFLAHSKWKGREVLDSLISIPMVLPPTVLGYYLLIILGRNSWLGKLAERLGTPLVFTTRGAIIAATVVSIPFFIKTARSAIEGIPSNLLDAARVLGRTELSIFFFVIIPNAWRGIATGLVLMFARALGDFGTTLMVSGGIPGETLTMPIAIYNSMLAGDQSTANLLALIMAGTALLVLILINILNRQVGRRGNR